MYRAIVAWQTRRAWTLDIRWGRIVRVRTLEDTQKLAGALERLSQEGVEEATAPAISDASAVAA